MAVVTQIKKVNVSKRKTYCFGLTHPGKGNAISAIAVHCAGTKTIDSLLIKLMS